VDQWLRKLRYRAMPKEDVRHMIRLFFSFLLIVLIQPPIAAVADAAVPTSKLIIDSALTNKQHVFDVELALTNAQRAQGLMHRTELAPNRGMLFVFPDSQKRSFWMRNTLISLDIIFLRSDGRVVNIVHQAEPQTEVPRRSTAPSKAVLELIGGRADELGIKPGDFVRHALLGNLKAE